AGTSMITLWIPPKDQISRVASLLMNEYSTASNIKSRVNRQSVLSAIQSAQHIMRLYAKVPPNGLVVFTGNMFDSEGKEKKLNLNFEPFAPVPSSLYLCDNKFHTDVLQNMCDDDEVYGFIILDGSGCLIGTLCGQNRRILFKNTVELPKKHRRGGQSAPRFQRIRMEARQNHLTKTSDHAKTHLIQNNKAIIKGLILAGSADFKNKLFECQTLDYRLRAIIICTVDIGYGGEQGFNEAIEKSSEALGSVKHIQEDKLLREFMSEIERDTGMYCFGVDQTMAMLYNSGIKKLFVYENLDIERVTMRDPADDSEHIFYIKPKTFQIGDRFKSKISGNQMIQEDKELLIDYLLENYRTLNVNLNLISDKTQRGSQFANGLGGIAAILHYKFDVTFMPDYEDRIDVDDNVSYSDDTDDIDAL
ncbi:MAG: Electron transfer flavoprotein alpha-subunit, partial [Paramarteilia canceri]